MNNKWRPRDPRTNQQVDSRQDRILNIYIQEGGSIDVIANCHGRIPCSDESEKEFRKITKQLIGMKVMGVLYAGTDGLEVFYECKQDESVYVLKTYHEPGQTVTIFGKLIVEES